MAALQIHLMNTITLPAEVHMQLIYSQELMLFLQDDIPTGGELVVLDSLMRELLSRVREPRPEPPPCPTPYPIIKYPLDQRPDYRKWLQIPPNQNPHLQPEPRPTDAMPPYRPYLRPTNAMPPYKIPYPKEWLQMQLHQYLYLQPEPSPTDAMPPYRPYLRPTNEMPPNKIPYPHREPFPTNTMPPNPCVWPDRMKRQADGRVKLFVCEHFRLSVVFF